jgi:hypothetical protein
VLKLLKHGHNTTSELGFAKQQQSASSRAPNRGTRRQGRAIRRSALHANTIECKTSHQSHTKHQRAPSAQPTHHGAGSGGPAAPGIPGVLLLLYNAETTGRILLHVKAAALRSGGTLALDYRSVKQCQSLYVCFNVAYKALRADRWVTDATFRKGMAMSPHL